MLRASRTSLFDLHSPCFTSEGVGVPVKSQWRHSRPINKEKRATGFWVPSEGAHVEALVPSRAYLASSWSFTHEKSFRGAGSALRESTTGTSGSPFQQPEEPHCSCSAVHRLDGVSSAPCTISSSPLEGPDTLHRLECRPSPLGR